MPKAQYEFAIKIDIQLAMESFYYVPNSHYFNGFASLETF